MPTRSVKLPDGRTKWIIDSDDLFAAGMLEDEGSPQLSVEEFDELVSALGTEDQPDGVEEIFEAPPPRKAPRKRRAPRVYD